MLTATRPASVPPTCYQPIPTTTVAKRPPETLVEYDAPVLAIRKGRAEELYDVAEFPTGWEGRAFRLTKDRTSETYDVFLARNGQDSRCDCIGHEQHGRCKHLDAMTALLHSDQLPDPRSLAPVEEWPSPEQLAAEAGIDLPF